VPQVFSPSDLVEWFNSDRLCYWNVGHYFGEGFSVDGEEKCPVSGKRKYATEREALATAAHQIASANAPKELRAYRCSWCEAWHLTKGAGKGGRARG
jgi:hypothetical protein